MFKTVNSKRNPMKIRKEVPLDTKVIRNINVKAFETEAEANLVDVLRDSGCAFVSLVAEIDQEVVGHILFTPVELSGTKNTLKLMGLAPMAVLPQYQNQGIGTQLVKAGIEYCQSGKYDAIVVLGHPNYYPKFGFVPSVNYGIKSEYEVPDEAFMLLELVPNSLKNHRGTIKYHELFNSV